MRLLKSILTSAIAAVALFCSASAFAQGAGSEPRVVLKGYDPVAYFTQGKPVKGSAQLAYDWDEGRYYFANAGHRDLFAGDPDRYAPRFGGHCTGSMSRGVKNEGDPEIWTIVDGKLYLMGSGKGDKAGKEIGLRGIEKLKNDPATVTALAQQKWQERK